MQKKDTPPTDDSALSPTHTNRRNSPRSRKRKHVTKSSTQNSPLHSPKQASKYSRTLTADLLTGYVSDASGVLSDECVEATPSTHVLESDSSTPTTNSHTSSISHVDPNNNTNPPTVDIAPLPAVPSSLNIPHPSSPTSPIGLSHSATNLPKSTNSSSPNPNVAKLSDPTAQPSGSRHTTCARVDLNSLANPPTSTARQIYLNCDDPQKHITSLNPLKLKIALDSLCGPVEAVEYLRNRTLLITVASPDQIPQLLKAKTLPEFNLPITTSVAWTRQLTYGKLFARELASDSLEEILNMLRPNNVVAVRRLFNDPNKAHIPLYVLTFLGPCPTVLKLGYIRYTIDKYIPSPMRCRQCWRLRHTAAHCRSSPTCSFCSSTEHTRADCTAAAARCVNCKGAHSSTSPTCPEYLHEQRVCELQSERGVSFAEARALTRTLASHQPPTPKPPTQIATTPHTVATPVHAPLPDQTAFSQDFPPLTTIPIPLTNSPSQSPGIPPGQPPPTRNWAQNDQIELYPPSQMSLPPLSPHPSIPPPQPNQQMLNPRRNHQMTIHESTQNVPQPEYARESLTPQQAIPSLLSPAHLISMLPKILPLIVRLFLSNTIVEKVECFSLIGRALKLDDIMAAALSAFDHSQPTPVQ